MTTHIHILKFITLLRGDGIIPEERPEENASFIIEEVFLNGNCRNLAEMLKMIAPTGIIRYTKYHAVFEFKGRLYDIRGDVTGKYTPSEFTHSELDLSVYGWEDRGPSY